MSSEPAPNRSYRRLLIGMAVLGIAIDLGTKYWAFAALYNGTPQGNREVVPGWFRFTAEYDFNRQPGTGFVRDLQLASAPVMPHVNYGALFGLGGQHKGEANMGFAALSVVAAIGIGVWGLAGAPRRDRVLSFALGLILGGTVGNLYDRLVFGGVRDFLYFYRIEYPVFNYADCTLVVGMCILVLHAFLTPAAKAKGVAAK